MSVEFIFRIIGMFICGAGGVYLGVRLADLAGGPAELYALVLGLLGALIGF